MSFIKMQMFVPPSHTPHLSDRWEDSLFWRNAQMRQPALQYEVTLSVALLCLLFSISCWSCQWCILEVCFCSDLGNGNRFCRGGVNLPVGEKGFISLLYCAMPLCLKQSSWSPVYELGRLQYGGQEEVESFFFCSLFCAVSGISGPRLVCSVSSHLCFTFVLWDS